MALPQLLQMHDLLRLLASAIEPQPDETGNPTRPGIVDTLLPDQIRFLNKLRKPMLESILRKSYENETGKPYGEVVS